MQIVITNGRPFTMDDNYTLVPAEDGVYEVKGKQKDLLSAAQMRSLHLYFRMLSDALNSAGLDIKQTVKADVSWTPEGIKELIFRPILKALYNKKSTTALKKDEIDTVYHTINRLTAEKWGISIAFPSVDEMLFEKNYKEMR